MKPESRRQRHFYKAYNLVIDSPVELPGLLPLSQDEGVETTPDIRLKLVHCTTAMEAPPLPDFAPPFLSTLSNCCFLLTYPDKTEFELDQTGRQITARIPPSGTVEDMVTYLQGPVLGFALQLRGMLCLHASVVSVNRNAFALVGPSGQGKSTLAAKLLEFGAKVIADDILVVDPEQDVPTAKPGYPRLRLWPDSVEFLKGSPDALPLMAPRWNKRFMDLNEVTGLFDEDPRALKAIYLLNPKSECSGVVLDELFGANSFVRLYANIYPSPRFYPPQINRQTQQFDAFRSLTDKVNVFGVEYRRELSELPVLCAFLVDDMISRAG